MTVLFPQLLSGIKPQIQQAQGTEIYAQIKCVYEHVHVCVCVIYNIYTSPIYVLVRCATIFIL